MTVSSGAIGARGAEGAECGRRRRHPLFWPHAVQIYACVLPPSSPVIIIIIIIIIIITLLAASQRGDSTNVAAAMTNVAAPADSAAKESGLQSSSSPGFVQTQRASQRVHTRTRAWRTKSLLYAIVFLP